ncbi:MAG: anti-sigma regulatory factor [Desulfitobacteriaceae bacterium]|nr:anti-sigma regulatory factor [Desulfitobacteriaceae bacterium]MDD4346492.1 anti-sigma regulatory factor [Desulfitobacteriaceae bacterium]MDD4401849.1 anti-sigma regulatory factor [Desulfitobacteriaceae bacterium]
MSISISVDISTENDIVTARQKGRFLAKELGFSIVDQCRIATGISELARNIFLYAPTGKIIISSIVKNSRQGIAIVAEDNGPGISDIKLALLDGFSTSNGLGMGLPGCQRLMDEFEIKSELDIGTKIVIKKWLD